MPQVTDTWVIDLKLNDSSFNRSFSNIKKSLDSLSGTGTASNLKNITDLLKGNISASSMARAAASVSKLATSFTGVIGAAGGATVAIVGVVAAIAAVEAAAITAKIANLGLANAVFNYSQPFLQAYANVQQLEFALKRLGFSATQVKETIALGKLPGLTREQAVQATAGFAAGGFGVEQAQALTTAFSKAATSAEQFTRVQMALNQMLSKGKVTAEELTGQLAEALPGLPKYLQAAFGTKNVEEIIKSGISPQEFIKKLALEINKLPSQTNSAQSSLDNLADSIENLKASVGEGLATTLIPFITILTEKFDALAASGTLQRIGEQLATIVASVDLEETINSFVLLAQTISTVVTRVSDFLSLIASLDFVTPLILGINDALTTLSNGFVNFADVIAGLIPGFGGIKAAVDTGMRVKEAERLTAAEKLKSDTAKDTSKATFDAAGKVIEQIQTEAAKPKITKTDEKEKEKQIIEFENANEIQKKQLEQLKNINKNTNPDLQAMILGGGNIGRLGTSVADISAYKNKNKRGVRNEVFTPKVMSLFEQMMSQIAQDIANGNIISTPGRYNF